MSKKRFEIIETEGTTKGIYVIVDTETNVQYIIAKFGAAGGICPLIDQNGKPLLRKS